MLFCLHAKPGLLATGISNIHFGETTSNVTVLFDGSSFWYTCTNGNKRDGIILMCLEIDNNISNVKQPGIFFVDLEVACPWIVDKQCFL